jgi:transcriptional regulator with XRE-family HTH domain
MCTIDTIIVILKRKNLKQKDLTDYLGLSKNAFTNWKAGLNESWKKYLPQIAEFLGVTVDELLGDRPLISYYPFTLPQKKVIELLTRLDDDDLMRIEGMIQLLLADDKYKKISVLPDA